MNSLQNERSFLAIYLGFSRTNVRSINLEVAKISEEQKVARRSQILNAGWRCFDRNGLHATRMNDIIAEAGLSAGAVYSYFKNKDDLIEAALTTSMKELTARLQPLWTAGDLPSPPKLLAATAAAIEDFTRRDGFDLKRIALLGWAESQRDAKLKGIVQLFYATFVTRLAECVVRWKQAGLVVASANDDHLAKALLALLLGYVVEAAVMGGTDPAIFRQGVEDLVASGHQ
jgi:TetR/AcrR family transcriptional regulator, transcriptional repressor of aconitase